ncbi:MAG: amidohydrolase [Calditrichaeota bacterium]|nr:MAG: amidohydrolase [Calditrichota bacterium]
MIPEKLDVIDAHTHFFSYTWLEHFFNLARDKFPAEAGVEALAKFLGWEMPPRDPRELAKQWIAEQNKYGLKAQVLFASKLNDAEFLAAAIQNYPERLIGYAMINPLAPEARDLTRYCLTILNMKGILMFPAMHHFYANDEKIYPVLEEAAVAFAPVFIHFGFLKIPIYQKLGLDDNIDLQYSLPSYLLETAKEFPEVNFIIPHFGCGYFEEALEVARQCKNVYFDTSSSNSWIQLPLTLKEVFRICLQELGARRLLFGTDSSYFPRGWRQDIFQQQWQILDELKVPLAERKLIFADNLNRLLNLK